MQFKELINKNKIDAEIVTLTVRGMDMTAKIPRGAGEILTIRKRSGELVDAVKSGAPESWRQYLPLPDDVLRIIGQLKYVLVEPKPNTVELLEMASSCGTLLIEIAQAYDQKVAVSYGLIGEGQNMQSEPGEVLDAAVCKEVDELKN